MDPLNLLPEECWMEVLLRVKAPKDLKSCSEACLIFEEILRMKKIGFMFDLILPNILEYLPEPTNQRRNLLLKCRLVCKSWRNSIDKLWARKDYSVKRAYCFISGEITERFLQKFATHVGNPFLGRSVYLFHTRPLLLAGNHVGDPDGDPEGTLHVRAMEQLLRRFGNQIWSVDLSDYTRTEPLIFFKNVQYILCHLTELRTLLLEFDYINNEELEELGQRENMTQLINYMEANPFPELPQLDNLKAHGNNVVMMRPILEKYAPNLKILALDDPNGFPQQGLMMSNLEELKFHYLEGRTPLAGLRNLEAPQLRSLFLSVHKGHDDIDAHIDTWHIDELFRNIGHLPIQRLAIRVSHSTFVQESMPIPADQRPSHGSISSIHLGFPICALSFNFLLYCPKLKDISITHGDLAGQVAFNGVTETLDVKGLIEQVGSDLYQSEIWERIPSLETFRSQYCFKINLPDNNWDLEFRDDHCTRGEYEKRKIENGQELLDEH